MIGMVNIDTLKKEIYNKVVIDNIVPLNWVVLINNETRKYLSKLGPARLNQLRIELTQEIQGDILSGKIRVVSTEEWSKKRQTREISQT